MALNPNTSLLDQTQILQRSFDEDEDRLRVDAEVTAVIGTVEVIISAASGDSIIISDGVNNAEVTSDGELKVSDAGISSLDSKLIDNYGVSTQALRTASQIGNTTGQADFNRGASSAQTLRSASNISDGSGNSLTSTLYATNRTLHVQSPDNSTSTTTLSAVNANVSINLEGLNSVGFQLNAGTFVGTLLAEASVDGGTTWTPVPFYDPVNSAILTNLAFSPNTITKILSIIPIGGASNVRVRVSQYTSGSATSLLRAANVTGATGAITAAAFSTVSNNIIDIPNNSPILILSGNVNRKYAYFGNNSVSTIRLQFSTSTNLSNATGIPLPSQTGFYELKGDNLFTGDIYAFSSSDVQISVTEGTP